MPVTLKDIAEKTGFSITTVSRALAGYDDVNAQTRQRITRAAQELGYHPNHIARQLQSRRTDTLGMIIPAHERGMTDDFFSEFLLGISRATSHYGYDLLIATHHNPQEETTVYKRFVAGNRVDGVVLARTRRDDPRIRYLQQAGLPFAVAGRLTPDDEEDFPFVDVDNAKGVHLLVAHLVALGHRHMGLILPPTALAFTPYRFQGYQDGLAEAGIAFEANYMRYGDLSQPSGATCTHALLDAHPHLTAIIACNDQMALGVLSAIQARGQALAVVGFDDIPAAQLANPPLTTIHQPIDTIAGHLLRMLVGQIRQEADTEQRILLEPELIVRASSGSYLAS